MPPEESAHCLRSLFSSVSCIGELAAQVPFLIQYFEILGAIFLRFFSFAAVLRRLAQQQHGWLR